MDDEVFKMVNIEGQVGFRRAGWFFFLCIYIFFGIFIYIFCFGRGIYMCFGFVSSNNRKQKYRAVSWQRNSGSREEKKNIQGWGEKRKK